MRPRGDPDKGEQSRWRAQADATGVCLSDERLEAIAEGIRRLEKAAVWLRDQDPGLEGRPEALVASIPPIPERRSER